MSFLIVDPQMGTKPELGKGKVFARGGTALSRALDEAQEGWLLEHVAGRWQALHGALADWRNRLGRFERLADEDYSDRTVPNREKSDAPRSIFERQNHTLGLVSGKCDQVYAQAKDDLFGTRPWLSATPQGAEDVELADRITKHSQWKFDQSNLESVLADALKVAVHLGTAFPKLRWVREEEEYEAEIRETIDDIREKRGTAAYRPSEAGASRSQGGAWRTVEVYNNVEAAVLDWKDVAFDPLAPELDLRHTDFLCRFKMGVHDLASHYGMTAEEKEELLEAVRFGGDEAVREHRGEMDARHASGTWQDVEANPVVWLVEGFVRCDVFNTGRPVRLHVIFSPELHALFRCDYLANVTPGGMLPVFPVRCFKEARRIVGKGYWERFEDANDAVDGLYNATTLRNRKGADVFKGYHRGALVNEGEGQDVANHAEKLFELKPDKTIDDLLQFKVLPDTGGRSDALLQQMLQMANLRMGTSSASQGALTGIPENDTATGSRINAGRAALLDKAQIGQMTGDLRAVVEFAVHLNYANLEKDEVFTWGEGKDAELMEIKAGDVQGLRANVSLVLTQSQNLQRLEAAKTAIQIALQYVAVPEEDKGALRRLFVQALSSMGFHDADRIIRKAREEAEAAGMLEGTNRGGAEVAEGIAEERQEMEHRTSNHSSPRLRMAGVQH